jgi:hypothetical protein
MPWNAQSLATLLGVGASLTPTSLARAIVGPRWELRTDGGLRAERGFEAADRAELAAAADVIDVERWALRSAMQIVAVGDGLSIAAVDPRTVGAVLPV